MNGAAEQVKTERRAKAEQSSRLEANPNRSAFVSDSARAQSAELHEVLGTGGALDGPVQARTEGPVDADRVKEAAASGFDGSSASMPHAERIQKSFGHHDIGSIKAFVGGPAAEASSQMGARAYTSGANVAFKSDPDLHTAAHEAAHVVQQRAGVQLPGGVGRVGDAYEKHADAVADAVVSGRSAQGLLDQSMGGAASVQRAVQRAQAPPGGAEAHQTPDRSRQALYDMRIKFEDKLGAYGHQAAESNDAMAKLCDYAWKWIWAVAAAHTRKAETLEAKFKELVLDMGLPLETELGFAGRVGKDVEAIKAVFKKGNLRERFFVLNSFIAGSFGNEILNSTDFQLKRVLNLFDASDATKKAILDRRQETFDQFGVTVGPNGKPLTKVKGKFIAVNAANAVMQRKNTGCWVDTNGNTYKVGTDTKLPATPVAELEEPYLRAYAKMKGYSGTTEKAKVIKWLQDNGHDPTPTGEMHPYAWSVERRKSVGGPDKQQDELSEKDVEVLSSREAKAVNPLGDELMPTIRGDVANVLNDDHPWIKLARDEAMPLRGGPSGTTERFMNLNTTLATGVPHPHVRLAMLGFFMTGRGHSFHEIMTAADGHPDCTYTAGVYHPVPPVADDLLSTWAVEAGAQAGLPQAGKEIEQLSSEFSVNPADVRGSSSSS